MNEGAISSPAAAISTTVKATSPAINACRRRTVPAAITVRLAIEERRSTFLVTNAGNMPNKTLVNKVRESVKASTRLSRETVATGRKCCGKRANRPRSAGNLFRPAPQLKRASSRFSIQKPSLNLPG